jgi:hypothetical protein
MSSDATIEVSEIPDRASEIARSRFGRQSRIDVTVRAGVLQADG